MNIYLTSRNARINAIAQQVVSVVYNENFHDALVRHGDFEMSSDQTDYVSGKELSAIIKGFAAHNDVSIRLYRSWNPWSKVNGYFQPNKGVRRIHLNKWRLNRSSKSIFETIFHELVHVIDYNDGRKTYFGHGDNSAYGKGGTAPWAVSRIAAQFYQD